MKNSENKSNNIKKLSQTDKNRLLARSLFCDAKKEINEISEILDKTPKTISNYKAIDQAQGYDWLGIRTASYIETSQSDSEAIYSNFVSFMYDSIKDIREDDSLKPEQKADKIASVADGFAKMRKIVSAEDPEAYKLGIIKHTITTLINNLKSKIDKDCLEEIVATLNLIEEDLLNVSI